MWRVFPPDLPPNVKPSYFKKGRGKNEVTRSVGMDFEEGYLSFIDRFFNLIFSINILSLLFDAEQP